MNKKRQIKLVKVLLMVLSLSIVAALVLYALRQNISLFYTPSQLLAQQDLTGKWIRLGGMVVQGSVVRDPNTLSVQFQLTDFKKKVTVTYQGILPDLFREGQGIVAAGQWSDGHTFKASDVLAKHDEKYMPPELKASLDKVAS